jgi:hypothetical protein
MEKHKREEVWGVHVYIYIPGQLVYWHNIYWRTEIYCSVLKNALQPSDYKEIQNFPLYVNKKFHLSKNISNVKKITFQNIHIILEFLKI